MKYILTVFLLLCLMTQVTHARQWDDSVVDELAVQGKQSLNWFIQSDKHSELYQLLDEEQQNTIRQSMHFTEGQPQSVDSLIACPAGSCFSAYLQLIIFLWDTPNVFPYASLYQQQRLKVGYTGTYFFEIIIRHDEEGRRYAFDKLYAMDFDPNGESFDTRRRMREQFGFVFNQAESQAEQICLVFNQNIKANQPLNQLVTIMPTPADEIHIDKNKLCFSATPSIAYYVHIDKSFESADNLPLYVDVDTTEFTPLSNDDSFVANGASFAYKDWELHCDNTHTCRAVGYTDKQALTQDNQVLATIKLTREAGEATPVLAEINLVPAYADEEDAYDGDNLCPKAVQLQINGKNYGEVLLANTCLGALNEQQTQQLRRTLTSDASIAFIANEQVFPVSDDGATAVLLKMDEYQQRIGKPSALIKKGSGNRAVLPPADKPIIQAVAVPVQEPQRVTLTSHHQSLLQSLQHISCQEEIQTGFQVHLYPLNKDKTLMEVDCMSAAYNFSNYYVVVDNALSQVLAFIGEGQDFNQTDSTISGSWKGRGVGDCWYVTEYVWNGDAFVLSYVSDTGMCRGFTGGAWQLPSYVSEVKSPETITPNYQ